jgi:3-oxoacyl-[acyl-carrier protein] reductase
MTHTLKDKIALVTGASRGLGQAIALELARQGAIVLGTATTAEGAQSISAKLKEHGVQGKGYAMNVRDHAQVNKVVEEITQTFGAPLILVNNAGVTRDNLFLRMSEDEWETVIDTNLTSIFRVTKAVMKGMIKARWGRIISISSVAGVAGNPGQCNYAASKAGMIGFTKSLAQEIASRNITVNIVAPGLIQTDMNKALSDKQREAILGKIPLNKLGDPEDIATSVAYLASPAAGYITGQTLNVNGGMYML